MRPGGKVMRERLRKLEPTVDVLATGGALAVVAVIFVESTATDTRWLQGAAAANWMIWWLFVADALIKALAHGCRWLRTRMAWFDFFVIAVSYPGLGSLLAFARLARLLRLGRLSRTARLARLSRLLRAVRLLRLGAVAARGLVGLHRVLDPRAFPFVTLVVILVVAAGGGALYLVESGLEPLRIEDALWWAVTTVTTVGYGDLVPHTGLGRCIAVAVMLIGITFTSLLTANIAAYLTRRGDERAQDDVLARLDALTAKVDQLGAELARLRSAARCVDALRDRALADAGSESAGESGAG